MHGEISLDVAVALVKVLLLLMHHGVDLFFTPSPCQGLGL
jgi:hypothetical protein